MAKILLLDEETSYMLTSTFTLYPESISPKNIVQDWHIICASWKWLGEKEVFHEIANGTNDKKIVKALAKAISEADLLVFHNGRKFDLKKLKTRAIYHGLPPIKNVNSVDTLLAARKEFGFSSNRLGYLAEYLGLPVKKMKPADDAWVNHIKGNRLTKRQIALEMLPYCDTDVLTLEQVYLRMRPHISNHPDVTGGHGLNCRNCGSSNLVKRGYYLSKTKRVQQYQCKDCASWRH